MVLLLLFVSHVLGSGGFALVEAFAASALVSVVCWWCCDANNEEDVAVAVEEGGCWFGSPPWLPWVDAAAAGAGRKFEGELAVSVVAYRMNCMGTSMVKKSRQVGRWAVGEKTTGVDRGSGLWIVFVFVTSVGFKLIF